jgi:hypothetical protein
LEVLCVKDLHRRDVPGLWRKDESLEELDETDVFLRRLEIGHVSAEERPGLLETYREVLHLLRTDDVIDYS